MESEHNPFALEPLMPRFESLGQDNGFRFWWGSVLAGLLGYRENDIAFRKAVEKAMATMTTLAIPVFDNIVQVERTIDGGRKSDFKLSRFACYLVAINGDNRKTEVAAAQAYFVSWAQACQVALENSDNVERVTIRGQMTEQEKGLNSTAKAAGVENYAFFANAGYRGMYNMDLRRLRQVKGVPVDRSPLDFMGKVELAANLFRITQTEEKIRNESVRGQTSLEGAAEQVGRKVRTTMREISGTRPESLPPSEDIREVQRRLKSGHREIHRIDKPKPVTKRPSRKGVDPLP